MQTRIVKRAVVLSWIAGLLGIKNMVVTRRAIGPLTQYPPDPDQIDTFGRPVEME